MKFGGWYLSLLNLEHLEVRYLRTYTYTQVYERINMVRMKVDCQREGVPRKHKITNMYTDKSNIVPAT